MKPTTRIKRLASKAEQHPLLPTQHAGPGRGHRGHGRKHQGGNSRAYLLARLARDFPQIHERLKAGEFATVRDAAREAGIVKDTRKAQPHELEDCAAALISCCPQAVREGLEAALTSLGCTRVRLVQGALSIWVRSRDSEAPRDTPRAARSGDR